MNCDYKKATRITSQIVVGHTTLVTATGTYNNFPSSKYIQSSNAISLGTCNELPAHSAVPFSPRIHCDTLAN